jgi:methylated-DNA-[protein]-cysteine S-methyltransferase
MRSVLTDNAGMRYSQLDSPIGPLLLGGSDDALCLISFPEGRGARRPEPGWQEDASAFRETSAQLRAYFDGELTEFDLPLTPAGNAFQLRVWQALRHIPYGETVTYGEIAERIGGTPADSRAVGAANAANPLPIVIPCHRVIGVGGKLVGFGGGLATKKYLLDLEFRVRPPRNTLFALG